MQDDPKNLKNNAGMSLDNSQVSNENNVIQQVATQPQPNLINTQQTQQILDNQQNAAYQPAWVGTASQNNNNQVNNRDQGFNDLNSVIAECVNEQLKAQGYHNFNQNHYVKQKSNLGWLFKLIIIVSITGGLIFAFYSQSKYAKTLWSDAHKSKISSQTYVGKNRVKDDSDLNQQTYSLSAQDIEPQQNQGNRLSVNTIKSGLREITSGLNKTNPTLDKQKINRENLYTRTNNIETKPIAVTNDQYKLPADSTTSINNNVALNAQTINNPKNTKAIASNPTPPEAPSADWNALHDCAGNEFWSGYESSKFHKLTTDMYMLSYKEYMLIFTPYYANAQKVFQKPTNFDLLKEDVCKKLNIKCKGYKKLLHIRVPTNPAISNSQFIYYSLGYKKGLITNPSVEKNSKVAKYITPKHIQYYWNPHNPIGLNATAVNLFLKEFQYQTNKAFNSPSYHAQISNLLSSLSKSEDKEQVQKIIHKRTKVLNQCVKASKVFGLKNLQSEASKELSELKLLTLFQ